MKKYIVIIIAALSVVSCTYKEMDEMQDSDKVRFTAIMEGVDHATKTYLGDEEEGLYPVYWNEGDQIKMFVSQHEISDGQGYQMDLESGAGTVESVFSGSVPVLPDGSLYYYAVYPYSLGASIGGSEPYTTGESPAEYTWDPDGDESNVWEIANCLEIPLPSVQRYSPHSFGRDYNPAIAVSRDQTLRFKNTCGLLRLNLTGNVKVGKITIKSDGNSALWGVLTVRYQWRQHSSEYRFDAYLANGQASNEYSSSSERQLLTLDCGQGVQLTDEPTDFYLVVPINGNSYWDGGDFYDFKFEDALSKGFTMRVYDTAGNEVFAKHTERDNSIHRSMIRNMPTVDVRSQILTDLSSAGTANSYIVAPDGGSYRFFAGNRGNSPLPVHDDPFFLQGAKAYLLWETRMSGTVPTLPYDIVNNVNYDPETQYISFNTTNVPGNALIALKDASDNVLWSWHIWSTDYDPEAAGSTDAYGSVIMMDRNLGALQKEAGDVSAYGLYYNWGRKDPFDAGYDLESRKFIFCPSIPFSNDPDAKPLDYFTKHPTTVVPAVGDIYDVSMADMVSLWGKEKTMYDPCPPGWEVADFDTFYQFAESYSKPGFSSSVGEDYWKFNESTPAAIYPGIESSVWTNHHNFTYWGAVAVNCTPRYENDDLVYRPEFGMTNYSSDLKHVRCQRTDTPIDLRPVIDLSAGGTANCYIAQPRHKYKINAMVKGNSNISTGMPANAAIEVYTENTTELHGTRYSWLEAEDVLITDCYLKDGYIYFSTSLDDLYGNAVVALKDPHGQILWSWHIWIVDYNPETSYDLVDWGEAGEKKFMTRNLGAINEKMYDSGAMGMMYQWGRKDPFMGAVAYDSNSSVVFEGENYGSVEASLSNSTIAYSLRNPSKAIMDETDGDGDWLDEHENWLWGEEKTIYDPCPRGWKVPSRPVYTDKSVSSIFSYGLQMDGIWYPATGYHHYVSFNLNEVGKEGHYWYATPKDDGHAYSFYFSAVDEAVDLANHYTPKAQLNAIRCVKDE